MVWGLWSVYRIGSTRKQIMINKNRFNEKTKLLQTLVKHVKENVRIFSPSSEKSLANIGCLIAQTVEPQIAFRAQPRHSRVTSLAWLFFQYRRSSMPDDWGSWGVSIVDRKRFTLVFIISIVHDCVVRAYRQSRRARNRVLAVIISIWTAQPAGVRVSMSHHRREYGYGYSTCNSNRILIVICTHPT